MSPPGPRVSARPWPRNVVLVARREILIRLRSRVFLAGTVVMVVAAAGGILAASYLNPWFLLGFALYAAAYATIAALVSRQEEVQSATAPITVLLAGSYILMFFALSDPANPWVTALSFVPPAAPIFIPTRIAEIGVEPWQVGLSMALMVAAIASVVWLAGRVYANAAMRTGMRVPLLEAFRG